MIEKVVDNMGGRIHWNNKDKAANSFEATLARPFRRFACNPSCMVYRVGCWFFPVDGGGGRGRCFLHEGSVVVFPFLHVALGENSIFGVGRWRQSDVMPFLKAPPWSPSSVSVLLHFFSVASSREVLVGYKWFFWLICSAWWLIG